MVRLSTHKDISGIVAVWKEAFGDSEKDIRFFLDFHYKPENTVIFDFDGEVASVLFLIDGDMHIKGKNFPSYYLYAACTLKKFRGMGMMSEMLDFAKNLAYQRNKFFIALKPAEDSLYDYYFRFGYQSVFSKRIINFSRNDSLEFNSNNKTVDYDYFRWSEKSVEFAIEHHKYYGGYIIGDSNGYILYSINNHILNVKKFTFPAEEFLKKIKNAASYHGVESIRVELPYNSDLDLKDSEIVKSGMLLPVSEDAEHLIKTIKNAYLSLTLD